MNVKNAIVQITLALVIFSTSTASAQGTRPPAPATPAPSAPPAPRTLADAEAAAAAALAPPATPAPPATSQSASADAKDVHPVGDRPAFKAEELEQMLAAVALYPDALLTQILMASTYPIEIVEADRWLKKNANLKGEALAKELEKQPWDPSVRSLVNFPDVLAMMSEQIGTTLKIGDAFIGQQKDVMDAVQRLRAKAKKEGNLETSEQMMVSTETAEAGSEVIIIESSSPDVIYVPSYDPVYVYGGWPYPSYPPYPYYPYPVVNPLLSFGVGVACGVAWGYAWGNCNWGGGDVDIDIDRNVNFNGEIDRDKFKQNQADRQGNRDNRQGDRQGNRDARQGDRAGGQAGQRGQGTWQHDPSHRQGVSYRNRDSANKVGAATTSDRATQARNDYRGKAETGRRDIAGGAADSVRGGATGARPGNTGAVGSRTPSTANRGASGAPSSMNKGGALNGSRSSGSDARASSTRGNASRSSSPSRSSGSRSSGGSRGGGSRGGGGRGR